MEWWTKVQLEVLRGESKKRGVLRREGISWDTLKKILEYSQPPGYRLKEPRPKPKIGPYLERIAQIIEEDKAFPKKQRHTAKRIYERIREVGYGGKYTQVKEAVRELLRVKQKDTVAITSFPTHGELPVVHPFVRKRLAEFSGSLFLFPFHPLKSLHVRSN